MSKKEKPKMQIHPAPGLCNACIEKGKFYDDDTVVVAYCPHNQTGGVYKVKWGVWEMSGPVCQEDFEELSEATRKAIRRVKQYSDERKAAFWGSKKWN